ncbi:MAG: LytTR family DNA-binding domain-containing protein [Defluviitaleaceae bacterium]|nr:LytTR family DNA-binding domain-containing protein [Defluviitaleaceae bacterium]
MTLFIAICDDEKRICAELETALIKILDNLNIACEVDIYFTGEILCEKITAGAQYDLIFLDIEFAKNAINGVEVGKRIRETYNNHLVSIVCISWKMQYSMSLFDIRPLNFLIKPLDHAKVEQVVKTYLDIAGLWTGYFTYKARHNTHKVPIKDIVYLQSDRRRLTIHLADGRKETFYGTLKAVFEAQLQGFDFLFIHASYVANYDYITAVKYSEVVLTPDGLSLPISQHKRKEVRETFYAITEKRRA